MTEEKDSGCCPNVEGCELYPMFVAAQLLRVWKERYCDDIYKTCQRFIRKSQGLSVDPTLLPNGRHLPVLK